MLISLFGIAIYIVIYIAIGMDITIVVGLCIEVWRVIWGWYCDYTRYSSWTVVLDLDSVFRLYAVVLFRVDLAVGIVAALVLILWL